MKTLLIICSCFFFGVFTPPILQDSTPPPVVEKAQEVDEKVGVIKIKIDFGRKKKNCRGFGICSISFQLELQDIIDILFRSASGSGSNVDGKFALEFDKVSMSSETSDEFFGKDMFRVDEAFEIPEEFVNSLNLESNVVKRGSYPIEDNGETFKVVF